MNGLKDKIIISTRPLSSDDDIRDYLISREATVIEFPMIEIVHEELNNKIEDAIKNIDSFDWIIFTSKNGVNYFFRFLEQIRHDKSISTKTKIAAIGNKTAEELKKNGVTNFFVSNGNTSDIFLKELTDQLICKNSNVLLPFGNLANNTLEKGLSPLNKVTRIDVYKTVETKSISPEIIEKIRYDKYDLIIFTSPSGFVHFQKVMKENNCNGGFRMACIGKTTEKEIIHNGYKPVLVSAKYDGINFAREIEIYFNSK